MLPLSCAQRLAIWLPLFAILVRAEPNFEEATSDVKNDSITREDKLSEIHPMAGVASPDSRLLETMLNNAILYQLVFPELTSKQRKLGVNPGYQSYNDPKMKSVAPSEKEFAENNGLHHEIIENSEKVKDAFSEEEKSNKLIALSDMSKENIAIIYARIEQDKIYDIYFSTIVAVSSALLALIIVGAGICYHRYQKKSKVTEDFEYPTFGATGKRKDILPTSPDRKLTKNAQLFHYQHQKRKMISIDSDKPKGNRSNGDLSEIESEDDEGDYSVYECSGLAPTGEMEVRNPMFDEDSTPKAKKNGN